MQRVNNTGAFARMWPPASANISSVFRVVWGQFYLRGRVSVACLSRWAMK